MRRERQGRSKRKPKPWHDDSKLEKIKGISRIIAIASGKGGVGKTTATVSLALALALEGYRVAIFDADVYGPNVPLMLGVRRKESAEGFLPVGRAQNRAYIPPLERYGLKLMSIGLLVGQGQAVVPDHFMTGLIVTRTLKDVLWGEVDYMLLDLPPGTGEPQQTLLKTIAIDGAVVVTTPQQMAQMDAERGIDLFKKSGVPVLGIIENMSYVICPDCGGKIEVFARNGQLETGETSILARVPMHPDLSEKITPDHPLVTGAPNQHTAIFREVAAHIVNTLPLGGSSS